MPKKKGPGGKKRKKAKGTQMSAENNRELLFSGDDSRYAYVCEALGNGRYRVLCNDACERLAILRGSMRKRAWVRRNDVVLITLRDYQDQKCDIVHRYSGDEVNRLICMLELHPTLVKNYNSGECDDSAPGAPDDAACEDTLLFDADAEDIIDDI